MKVVPVTTEFHDLYMGYEGGPMNGLVCSCGRSLKDVNAKTTRAIIYSMPGGEIKIISITLKFVLSTQAAKTKPKGI